MKQKIEKQQNDKQQNEHNQPSQLYKGVEIIACQDCGYFQAYEVVPLVSDTLTGCKELIDRFVFGDGKIGHISQNRNGEPWGFLMPDGSAQAE